jgi:nucleotide-binding universal stress UspA family protein
MMQRSPPEEGVERSHEGRSAAFPDILCAIDGSRDAREAARQAVALCGPGASLSFVAVFHSLGAGLAAQADLGEKRASAALEEAAELARQAGIHASTELRSGGPTSDLLLEEAAGHDLLIVGCRGGSMIGGIMLGSTASQIAHRAEGPVLVARHSPEGDDFPQRVLLATDGSPGSWAAARTATRVAEARRSVLRLVYVPGGMHPERYREVLKQVAMIEETTGASPTVVDDPGHPAERICEAASADGSSLIAIGRRGVRGIRALGSVSERVVHEAPCSVIVVPPPDSGGD